MRVLLILTLISFSLFAKDNTQPLSSYLIATGTNSSGTESSPRSLNAKELHGWKSSKIKTSVDLTSSCKNQVIMKGELVGNSRLNYLKLLISNTSGYFKSLVIEEISFKLGESKQRFPIRDPEARSSIELNPGWWVEVLIPFPSKKEFKNISDISVVIPIQSPQEIEKVCGGRLSFKKEENLKSEYVSYNYLEFMLDTSLWMDLAGNTRKFGTAEHSGFAVDILLYPGPHHGFGFGTYRSGEIDSASTELSNELQAGENSELASSGYFILYSYRFKKKGILFHSTTGAGISSIEEERNDRFTTIQESFALTQKLYATYLFNKGIQNDTALDWGVGLGLHAMYVPSQEVHGVDTSGLFYGVGARLYFGI